MKALIIGCTGMLGHEVFATFQKAGIHTLGTQRRELDLTENPLEIITKLQRINPEVVINCSGILKPLAEKDPIVTIQVNSLAPHLLAKACSSIHAKLIHITTDCVYDGKKGKYTEEDTATPIDLYGTSKLAGEVKYGNHLTIRTSIIGHEQRKEKYNLLDWFLQNTEPHCNGFTNHLWNGVTTTELARFILFINQNHISFTGIVHFHGEILSKYHMLELFKTVYKKNVQINEYTSPVYCDRTLTSLRLHTLEYTIPPLLHQLEALKRANNM